MKNCRQCYSEIHARARVCPVCHSTITLFGKLSSFFLTMFPILTALVSLGFAFYEKYEKGIVQKALTQTESRLEVVEVQNEVAREAVVKLNRMLPKPTKVFGTAKSSKKSPADKIKEIDKSIADQVRVGKFDIQKLKKLEREKLELQNGRPIFRIAK